MKSRLGFGNEDGSGRGGKIVHGRIHRQRFSPYSRPSNSPVTLALPAPEPEVQRNPSWLRCLISGAGKLISSVLGSEESVSSPSECSSDCSSSEEDSRHHYEHEDHLVSDGLVQFNNRQCAVEGNADSLAIVPKCESKLVIERLLMQETFTRTEYNNIVEILRSRVCDVPCEKGDEGTQNGILKGVYDKREWHSLNQNGSTSENFNFSPRYPSVFSPRYYASEAVSTDIRNKAVMEAKKWVEEKKMSSSPICDQEYGPCILNTNMNQYCFDGDGSPIEMAKSYMQSLPPWKSPSFSSFGFKSPPSSGKPSCSIGTHLHSASKVGKRDYFSIGSWEPKENSRVSLKSIDNVQKRSNLWEAGSITRPLVLEPSRTSSVPTNFGNKVQDASCGSIFSDVRLKLHDRKADGVGHLMDMHEEISRGIVMETKEAFKEADFVPEVVAVDHNDHLNSDIASTLPNDDGIFSDKNQTNDVDATFVTEAHIGSIPATKDSLVLVSTMLDNGNSFLEIGTSQPKNDVPAEPSIQRSGSELNSRVDNAAEVNPDSYFKRAHSFTDEDENPHNRNFNLESMSNGRDDVSEGTHEHPIDVSSYTPTAEFANSSSKPQNEGTTKLTDQMLTESTELGRGKSRVKKVLSRKRWKGLR